MKGSSSCALEASFPPRPPLSKPSGDGKGVRFPSFMAFGNHYS